MRVSTSIAVACCSLMLAVAVCSPALAQGQGRRGDGGFVDGVSEIYVLQSSQVQKELELVDDQIAKIKELANARGEREGGGQDLSDDERERRATAAKERKAKLDAILLPAQQARLAEITLQYLGTSALNDEDIQTKLGITADQKTALTTLRDESRKAMGELFAGGRGVAVATDRAAAREKFAKAMAEANEKTLAVLTSEQKAEFEKMQGKKIEIDRAALGDFGSRGGAIGPGGGQGGRRVVVPGRLPSNRK